MTKCICGGTIIPNLDEDIFYCQKCGSVKDSEKDFVDETENQDNELYEYIEQQGCVGKFKFNK
jgi:Fe2+ or Zn2+ uptake regulation protein